MIEITYDIAIAIAKDAADNRMYKENRTCWNFEDRELAASVFLKLYVNDLQTKGGTYDKHSTDPNTNRKSTA